MFFYCLWNYLMQVFLGLVRWTCFGALAMTKQWHCSWLVLRSLPSLQIPRTRKTTYRPRNVSSCLLSKSFCVPGNLFTSLVNMFVYALAKIVRLLNSSYFCTWMFPCFGFWKILVVDNSYICCADSRRIKKQFHLYKQKWQTERNIDCDETVLFFFFLLAT